MKTPFERIGPGQVGRLVYQVIGRDGPILNPKNIRYLSPDLVNSNAFNVGPELGGVEAFAPLKAGIAGVNLLVNTGTLALAAANYSQCKKILEISNILKLEMDEIGRGIADLQGRVERIDMRIAENNFREALKHAFLEALREDEIDLRAFHCLIGDINNFTETLNRPLLFNFGIQLTSDLRKNLSALYGFLAHVRQLSVYEHNRAVNAFPMAVARFDHLVDYYCTPLLDLAEIAWHFGFSDSQFEKFGRKLQGELLRKFGGKGVKLRDEFLNLARKEVFDPIWSDREENDTTRQSEILCNVAANLGVNFQRGDEAKEAVLDIAIAWHEESDAALIFKVLHELYGLSDGYEKVFYKFLDVDEEEDSREEPEEIVIPYDCKIEPDIFGVN